MRVPRQVVKCDLTSMIHEFDTASMTCTKRSIVLVSPLSFWILAKEKVVSRQIMRIAR